MLTTGILSARCFMAQVPMFAMVVASTALACYRLVPTSGLMGGAQAMVIGAAVRLVLTALVIGYLLLVHARYRPGHSSPPPRMNEWKPSL